MTSCRADRLGRVLGETVLSREPEDRSEIAYPNAQSRPEDTAGIKKQRRAAWLVAILVLLGFIAVSSLLMR